MMSESRNFEDTVVSTEPAEKTAKGEDTTQLGGLLGACQLRCQVKRVRRLRRICHVCGVGHLCGQPGNLSLQILTTWRDTVFDGAYISPARDSPLHTRAAYKSHCPSPGLGSTRVDSGQQLQYTRAQLACEAVGGPIVTLTRRESATCRAMNRSPKKTCC